MEIYVCMNFKLSLQEYGLHEYSETAIMWTRVWFARFQKPKFCMIPDKPDNGTYEHTLVQIMETLETIISLSDFHTIKKLHHYSYVQSFEP